METKADIEKYPLPAADDSDEVRGVGEIINVSGHPQELDRSFGFWSICSISICADNAWGAGGGSLVVAFYDGGAPGVLYEFIVVSLFYFLIGAALAELASAIPSSSSVYHWASVTGGPKYGRVCSWFAGWWNMFAWTFGTASASLFGANTVLAIYSLYHPAYSVERWHIFIAFLGVTWACCSVTLFGQHILPRVSNVGAAICIATWFVSVMVCAIMPSFTGAGHASNDFVWKEWQNSTGYSSNGFVFLAGMLNGAFAIGTPDGCTHLAEEIPNPKRNIPKGIVAQLFTGFITTLVFYIAILYAITSLDDVINSPISELPLAAVYLQATGGSKAGTTGLLIVFLLDVFAGIPAAYTTAGRMLWTLARDDATPCAAWLAKVSHFWRNPFRAQFMVGCACTVLGCIYLGSATAFNAFVGVFTILTTMSYFAAVMPHLLSRRRHVVPGPFWMSDWVSYAVSGTACAYIISFNVIFCFPYAMPVDAQSMNYSCVMVGGLTIILTAWYFWKRTRGYVGPRVALEAVNNEVARVNMDLIAESEKTPRVLALADIGINSAEK